MKKYCRIKVATNFIYENLYTKGMSMNYEGLM